ncbi:MAG: hypothetical protein FJ189_06860 [Gammaproteobacteria bacterium]|nr:hypothetical protein [Gammaproteobacteria bacterium]
MSAWILGYIALGVGLLLVIRWAERRLPDEFSEEFIHFTLYPGEKPAQVRILEALVTLSEVLGIVLYLPWILVWSVYKNWKARRAPRNESIGPPEPRFRATPDNLADLVTVEEVERRECIDDPLGAVPPLPFGHLHKTWERFRADLLPGDELWSFASPSEKGQWRFRTVRGYAVRREGVIVAEMVADGG